MAIPGPPEWRPINANDEAVYKGANEIIELAYKEYKSGEDGFLVGSDFDRSPFLRLPRGAPNNRFGNFLLDDLKGLVRPRQPDIVDFVDRTFFEIKPVVTFTRAPAKTVEQLRSLYRVTEAIRIKFGPADEAEWHPENVTWMPPDVLPMPGDPNSAVVTSYSKEAYAKFMKGLIIYEVWERAKRNKKKIAVSAAAITSKNKLFDQVLPKGNIIAQAIGEFDPDEPDYVIIAPRMLGEILDFDKRFVGKYGAGVPPIFDRRQPRAQLRDIMRLGPLTAHTQDVVNAAEFLAIGVGIVGGIFLVTTAGIFLAPEAVAAIAGAEVTTEAVGTSGVISLAARRLAMEAAKAAPEVGKAVLKEGPKIAAGVVFIVGIVAKATPNKIDFAKVEMVRAVPETRVTAYKGTRSSLSSGMSISDPAGKFPSVSKPIEVGDTVLYDSKAFEVIAKVTVR